MNIQNTPAENITPDVIKQWKAKHPQGIFKLSVCGLDAYVRMPSDKEMIKFTTASKADGRKLAKKFIRTIWLGGDLSIIDNDTQFDQTESEIKKIIKAKEVQILKSNGIEI